MINTTFAIRIRTRKYYSSIQPHGGAVLNTTIHAPARIAIQRAPLHTHRSREYLTGYLTKTRPRPRLASAMTPSRPNRARPSGILGRPAPSGGRIRKSPKSPTRPFGKWWGLAGVGCHGMACMASLPGVGTCLSSERPLVQCVLECGNGYESWLLGREFVGGSRYGTDGSFSVGRVGAGWWWLLGILLGIDNGVASWLGGRYYGLTL